MATLRPVASRTWGRQQQHDDRAIPLVDAAFAAYGWRGYGIGTEYDPAALRDALRQHSDATSLLIRFRPDRIYVHDSPARRTILCEIKSEDHGYPNFALEADSFAAARAWDSTGSNTRHVCVALVDLRSGMIHCAWASDLPEPTQIFVPERWDWRDTLARLEREWPLTVRLTHCPHRGGAGTAYLLLTKQHPSLQPIGSFLETIVS